MERTIQGLQEQLQQLSMEVQEDFSNLHSASTALQGPVQGLQEQLRR